MQIYLIGSYDRFGKCRGVKIGVSDDAKGRVKQLQTGSNDSLKLIAFWDCAGQAMAFAIEAEAHHKFRNHRMIGEWFYAKKLDKIIFWMSERLNSGPSFMDGALCEFYLRLARNREKKIRATA